jgi:hypothetical protein
MYLIISGLTLISDDGLEPLATGVDRLLRETVTD